MPKVIDWMRICDDMINLIISYLPIDTRRRLTKKEYIATLDWFMSTYHSLPVHDGKGLFPKMLLLSSFSRQPIVANSLVYGDDADIFIELMDQSPPSVIDHVPDDISNHPSAIGVFMSYLQSRNAMITCPHTMKKIVSMIPARHIEEIHFHIVDVTNMLAKYPEMMGYTFNCSW